MHFQKKKSQRKNRMIIDIKNLNKISKFDVYFMLLQINIISCVQNCKFISVINCVVFFHQWRVIEKNYHKLIVVIHRKTKQ